MLGMRISDQVYPAAFAAELIVKLSVSALAILMRFMSVFMVPPSLYL